MIDIVEEIEREAEMQKISFMEISRKSGVCYRSLSAWKTGAVNPSFYNVQCVLKTLGLEICLRKKKEENEENI